MGWREVPRDPHTGMPLPMWYDDTFDHYQLAPSTQRYEDAHHTFYPREALEGGDLSGQALRAVRIQRGPRLDHNWWHQIYEQPGLPRREVRRFGMIVLAAAGYMPDRAISFNAVGVPRQVALSPSQRVALWTPGAVEIEHTPLIRRYMLEYVVRQGLSIDPQTVDEFLHTHKQDKRVALGEYMIEMACQEATQPLQEVYSEAHRYRRIPQDHPQEVAQWTFNLVARNGQPQADYQAMVWLDELLVAA